MLNQQISEKFSSAFCVSVHSRGEQVNHHREDRLNTLHQCTQQNETADEGEDRLSTLCQYAQQKRTVSETADEREDRLSTLRQRTQQSRVSKTADDREDRLSTLHQHAQQVKQQMRGQAQHLASPCTAEQSK